MAKIPEKVNQVLTDIENDLVDLVKNAKEGLLAKVHPGEETPAEVSPDTSATSPEASPPGSPAPGGEAPPALDAGPPVDGGAPPEGTPPDGDGDEATAPPSHEEMVAVLRSLAPDQIQAWKAALDEVMSGGDAAGAPPPEAGAPPVGGPPGGAPEASPPMPDAMKSELVQAAVALNKAEGALKSKDETIATLQAQVKSTNDLLAKQEAELKQVADGLGKLLRAPNRRGVVPPAPASEGGPDPLANLSKSEVDATLRQVARRPDLTLRQRQALDNFVSSGKDGEIVRPLLAQARQ